MDFSGVVASGPDTFARKYRPADLEHYVGNSTLREKVFNRLNNENQAWPQTILLSGMTGCGKTTLARIIAREYMCENRGMVACGECMTCKQMDVYIETGRTDEVSGIYEIDIADNNRKDAISELIEDMEVREIGSDWKFYLMDEFHMATKSAQNMLLKRIEEPPPGVVILIATTDPQEIIATIKNRMNFKLHVERPTTPELTAHMATICEYEDIAYDNEGLRVICNQADHVIRNSLNFLEEVASSWGSATIDAVSKEFDVVQDTLMFDFIRAYRDRDYVTYTSLLFKIRQKMSLDIFKSSLINFITRGIYIKNGVPVEGLATKEIRKYGEFFKEFTEMEISRLIANLQKVSVGDIESNFLAFVYDERDYMFQRTETVEPKFEIEEPGETKGVTEDERRDRARARSANERKHQEEGEAYLGSYGAGSVSGMDILKPFPQAKRVLEERQSDG